MAVRRSRWRGVDWRRSEWHLGVRKLVVGKPTHSGRCELLWTSMLSVLALGTNAPKETPS